MTSALTSCFTGATDRVKPLVLAQMRARLEGLRPRRIVIKPNWVLHETDPVFPIRALVTDARVIEATVEACLELFPGADFITVGDCPLQSADWPRLCQQSGLLPVMERLKTKSGGRVVFRDLRREVFHAEAGGFLTAAESEHGDPQGYREVELGAGSHLESLSEQADRFGVNDYSADVTRSNHRKGSHRYCVSQTVLDADLFINLPKWKTHAKAGLTCALKNLVGINGDKACLPHFRRGAPQWGGDEYPNDGRWMYWLQTHLREALQKRSRSGYRALRPAWQAIKRLRGIETRLEDPKAQPRRFYAAGGAWPGNQTLWRMIYDLNLVVQNANRDGQVEAVPMRRYFCVVDGLICGEGNGPLQPLPRETGWLVFGEDPFAVDAALCWFMGFDPARLPVVAQRHEYSAPAWGRFAMEDLMVELDGRPTRVVESNVNLRFAPPPGWRNHLER